MHRRISGSILFAFLLLAIGCASSNRAGRVELTILHLNDLHARLLPDSNDLGGFARLDTALDQERAAAEHHLTLHAGDLVQGSPVSSIFDGVPVFTIANLLDIDVTCLGNHELDYGWKRVADFEKVANFPIIGATLLDEHGRTLVERGWVIEEVAGVRIAIIGAITENLPQLTSRLQRGPYRAASMADVLPPIVAELAQRSDLQIVLGHINIHEAEALIDEIEEVDLWVIGHDHDGLGEAISRPGRVIVNAGAYGRDYGRLRLGFDPVERRIIDWDWQRVTVDSGFAEDPAMAEIVATWEARVSEIVDRPIGHARRLFNRVQVKALVEGIMLEHGQGEVALLNFGGVRDVIPKGDLLERHIWNVMPFDNTVVIGTVPGSVFLEMRKHPKLDPELMMKGEIDADHQYRVVTSDWIVEIWEESGWEVEFEGEGLLLRDLIIDWIEKEGEIG